MTAGRRRLLLWGAAAVVLAVAVVLVYRARTPARGSTLDTSGRPGPDLTGSAAQEPSGGAAGVPGKLPPQLISEPDALQTGVQQANTVSAQSPQAIPPGWQTYTDPATGATYTTDVGGSPQNPPTYNPATGSWFEGALPKPVSSTPAPPPTVPSPTHTGQQEF